MSNVFIFTDTVKPRFFWDFYTFDAKLATPGSPEFCNKWSWGFNVVPLHCHEYKKNGYAQSSQLVKYLV